jgi:phosphoesterase RecJ-like protein
VPLKRVKLLRAALDTLEVDEALPVAWMTLPRSLMDENEASAEDLEGVIEHARSIEGTEVALLFRETVEGGTKVSLRSNGLVDVNAIARQFGGGGHVKASGILMGASLESARAQVLEATRLAVGRLAAATAGVPSAGSSALPTTGAEPTASDGGVGDSPASA